MRPKGAQAFIDGGWYKVGRDGRAYSSINGEWIISKRDPATISSGGKVKMQMMWLTKYCLSDGIKRENCAMAANGKFTVPGKASFYGPKEAFRTKTEAIINANQRKAAKIASLKKQLKKLDEIRFHRE